jgi:hypothetical protein
MFKGVDFVLESKQSFKDSYENKLIKCTDDKYRSKAEIWLKSPDRREYKGITFDPTGNAEINGFYLTFLSRKNNFGFSKQID